MAAAARTADVVVFGATGYTGRLVASYLHKRTPRPRLAIAGRSREKLEDVRREITGNESEVGIVIADADDENSLRNLAREAHVICNLVGPYGEDGRGLRVVKACIEESCDYTDLTGEPDFIAQSVAAYHERAQRANVRVVHACGYDSVPSDLCALSAESALRELDGPTQAITDMSAYVSGNGGVSGGTIASARRVLGTDPQTQRAMKDPYYLAQTTAESDRVDTPEDKGAYNASSDVQDGVWAGGWVMAAINERVVRRSLALLSTQEERRILSTYKERMLFGKGTAGWLKATTASLLGAIGEALLKLTRGGLIDLGKRIGMLPHQGDGPSEKVRVEGNFAMDLYAKRKGTDGSRVRVSCRGFSDPGYSETSKMIGECACGLLATRTEASDFGAAEAKAKAAADASPRPSAGAAGWFPEGPLPLPGGVLTPASAVGLPLVRLLRDHAGQRWDALRLP